MHIANGAFSIAAWLWRAGFAAAMLGLAGCGSDAQHCTLGRATDLELREGAGHIYTTAILNGVALRMIVDTGSTHTIVSKVAADRMGLGMALAGLAGGIGGPTKAYSFNTRSFQIGALTGTRFPLAVLDTRLPVGDGLADGILGADFLSTYDIDLDLRESKAALFKVVSGCTAPVAVLDQPLFYAPFSVNAEAYDFRPTVSVQVGSEHFRALIDTGATDSAIYRNAAGRVGLTIDSVPASSRIVSHGIGPHSVGGAVHTLPPITVGEITLSHLPVTILDQRSGNDNVDMLLGMDFLSRVHMWFSYSSHTLIMQYPPKKSPQE